ncbi:MAG TPA: hypothetical protein VFD30_06415 [Terriglobia bacterium]|jgi:hypothetical protein|nr:hypothetical protein [Terriglobia bacterium]
MDYVMSPGGLLVHLREDWPCAVCNPGEIAEGRGYCLCAACAQSVMAAAGAGYEDARALLDDITDALALLEVSSSGASLAPN